MRPDPTPVTLPAVTSPNGAPETAPSDPSSALVNRPPSPSATVPSGRPTYSFSLKLVLGAIAIATVPALLLGIWVSQKQLSGNSATGERSSPNVVLETGAIVLGAGAIAALLARLALRPLEKAAHTSNTLVNRLQRRPSTTPSKDHWTTLETNLKTLSEQLPRYAWQQESDLERVRIVMNLNGRLRESLSEEEVLRIAVTEIRQVLKTDRIALYRFDSPTDGTIIEESVLPGWPKMLWTTLADPCLADYLEQYQKGRVRAIDDIYNAGLDDCHIGLLERFAVKANLIAPILKGKQLYGLLIANQCSGVRIWQQTEIELYTQLAAQISFALDHAKLLEQSDLQSSQAQTLIDVTRRIRASLNEEDVLKTTVDEVRKVLGSDRVIVYSFDENWYGTVVAESVVPSFAKALRAQIYDPCFAEGYVDRYRAGRVQATADITQAGLTECHLRQLEPFEVKANLVAPILKGNQLFALLIAHQCSAPRNWKPGEVDFVTQIATQVGYALDHARVLSRVSTEGEQAQLLSELTRRIRETLVEDDVIKAVVTEMRRVLQADRVIVYQFDADWYGTVVAEAVVPGFPKALWAKIKDPCFAEGYVEQYRNGRVQATTNVNQAGLTACHLKQLEPFAVKANLVAPILKDNHLFGLLIAHQCSEPREWKPVEVDLVAQVATQVGFALEHARLLDQVEQAYQTAQEASVLSQTQHEALQQNLSHWMNQNGRTLQQLSDEMGQQLARVTELYHQIRGLQTASEQMRSLLPQPGQLSAPAHTILEEGEAVAAALNERLTMVQAQTQTSQLQQLTPRMQQLTSLSERMAQVVAQMKLQAMNAALEASRAGNPSAEFSAIGDRVLDLARQLDSCTLEFTATISALQDGVKTTASEVITDTEQRTLDLQLFSQFQQSWSQLTDHYQTLQQTLSRIEPSIQEQSTLVADIQQQIVDVANRAHQSSEKVQLIASSIGDLTAEP
jgi:twitching motility protein PilJ